MIGCDGRPTLSCCRCDDRSAPFFGAAGESGARKVVFVLPFISMVTEKVKHLQRVVAPYNRGRPRRQRIKVRDEENVGNTAV